MACHDEFVRRLTESNEAFGTGGLFIRGEYRGPREPIEFGCAICGYEGTSVARYLPARKRCPNFRAHGDYRNPLAKGHDQFARELEERNPHFATGELVLVGEYTGLNHRIAYRCNACGKEQTTQAANLLRGCGCPDFRRHAGHSDPRTLSHEDFLERLHASSRRFRCGELILLEEYRKMSVPILCKCRVCGRVSKQFPGSLLKGHRCGNWKEHPGAAFIKAHQREARAAAIRTTPESFKNRLMRVNPNFSEGKLKLLGEFSGWDAKLAYRCTTCGHVGEVLPRSLMDSGCIRCRDMAHVKGPFKDPAAKEKLLSLIGQNDRKP